MTNSSKNFDYVRVFFNSLKSDPKLIEKLKKELKRQITRSSLTLIKGGR